MPNETKKPEKIIAIAPGYEADAGQAGVGDRSPNRRAVVAVAEYADGVYRACIINTDGNLIFAPSVVHPAPKLK